MRASAFFSEEERGRIREAVREAEHGTAGEIIPVVASASADYERSEDLVGLWVATLGLLALWWLCLPATRPGTWAEAIVPVSGAGVAIGLLTMLGSFGVGVAIASQITWLRRLFTSRALMRREVERAAARVFFEHSLRGTRGRTGLLIYVSLFERMVRVTGDQAIAAELSDQDWDQVCELILAGIREGKPGAGMVAGIQRCGEILARHLPIRPGDTDGLGNDLRVID